MLSASVNDCDHHVDLQPLKCPVRVLIRTQPTYLEKIHPSLEEADGRLIQSCVEKMGSGAGEIRHLATKISNAKRFDRVEIVFDYGVPTNDREPAVRAFKVRVGRQGPEFTQLQNPQIRPIVNKTMDIWEAILAKHDMGYPRRTDVRRKQQGQSNISVSSTSAIPTNLCLSTPMSYDNAK
ncbi:hypothetical protein K469DRAFT_375938 [Zopfia rhizophila CBS 207.26]|uniref:Uncharacterized protein n=1 Tax=Zopfia rhizophila CBS 207.26 TaxID=1314779 RepID=A0A6A6DE21_9PEZI|nr:hypothetical protein K469DRAFT_375938 [Zopfia rhizophila CBS 207.26]